MGTLILEIFSDVKGRLVEIDGYRNQMTEWMDVLGPYPMGLNIKMVKSKREGYKTNFLFSLPPFPDSSDCFHCTFKGIYNLDTVISIKIVHKIEMDCNSQEQTLS